MSGKKAQAPAKAGIRNYPYDVRAILEQALTPFRIEMAGAIRSDAKTSPYTALKFDSFCKRLGDSLPDRRFFDSELKNVESAIDKGLADQEPNLGRPELQLLWAAALLYIDQNKAELNRDNDWTAGNFNAQINNTKLWQQVTGSYDALNEMVMHAHYVSEALRRQDTKFRWGKPGSWFYFHPDENIINVDLVLSLTAGFEHSRGILFHEIGHSQLTTRFLPRQVEIREQMKPMLEKVEKKQKLKRDEYRTLRMLSAEWDLLHKLFDSAENPCVDRYAANMGRHLAQEYGYSLNHTKVTVCGYGPVAQKYLEYKASGQKHDFDPYEDQKVDAFIAKQLQGQEKNLPPELLEEMREAVRETLRRQKEEAAKKSGPGTASEKFSNVMNFINMTFYRNNGFFPHTESGWRTVNVRPDWIRRTDADAEKYSAADKAAFPHKDMAQLMALCQKLEDLQPRLRDRYYGRDYFIALTDDFAAKRCAVMEEIWDLYLDKYAKEMLLELEEKLDEELNKKKEKGQGQDQDQDQDQDGDDQDQDQDGQKGQKGQKGKKGKKGQKGEKGEQGDESGDDQDADGDSQDQDGQKQDKKDKKKGDKGKKGEKGDEQEDGNGGEDGDDADEQPGTADEGQSKPGRPDDDFKPEDAGKKTDGPGDNKNTEVENENGDGSEKHADVKAPPESPQGKESQPGQDGQSQDGQDNEGAEPKSLQELLDEMNKKDQEDGQKQDGQEQGQDGQDGQDGQPGGPPGGPPQNGQGQKSQEGQPGQGAGSGGQPKTLNEIALGDWTNYPEVVAKLAGPISQAARLLKKIQDRQLESDKRRSRRLDVLPEDNEIDRLSHDAHRELIIKRRTGQKLEETDLNRFELDEETKKPTKPDIVILIDGSGSMTMGATATRANPMQMAILSSTIIYEAAKSIGANVYIALWGNSDPIILAKPGDNPRDIGANLIKARAGLNCGTDLKPSIVKITKTIAEQRTKAGEYSGRTHMMVISDGDISDKEPSKKVIAQMLNGARHVTLDFAILKSNSAYSSANKTQMETLADEIRALSPAQKITTAVTTDPERLPTAIIGTLFDKIRGAGSFEAMPNAQKRRIMRRVHGQMDIK